jgi:methylphosphotriester-DNA--protein-cysteine methyltransferase
MPPPGPHGEPPEEPRDATVAALVAELEDEVVVVDEQPRYHLPGCRSLPGRQVIPLPAKEAVELGFTPCGWCTPDRTMASRHQAAAR